MKNAGWVVACVCASVAVSLWLDRAPVQGAANPPGLTEGIIYSVAFAEPDGKTSGFTRANSPAAVPGRNGTWNENAYGVLYENYLVITFPDKKDFAEYVVPARFVRGVQFGNGGITKMSETAKQ